MIEDPDYRLANAPWWSAVVPACPVGGDCIASRQPGWSFLTNPESCYVASVRGPIAPAECSSVKQGVASHAKEA